MSVRVFRSPRSGSVAAATAPARLAKELGEALVWRERGDGVIEVAARRKAHLDRYVVNPDGTTRLVESGPPLSPIHRGTAIWVSGVAVTVAGGLLRLTDLPGLAVLGWIGFALIIVGLNVRSHWADPKNRLKKLGDDDWHRPTDLRGWEPQSSEQLAAVEDVADEHDGLAYVRDLGTRTVEVYGKRRSQLERFWVDERGRTELMEVQSLDRRGFPRAVLAPAFGFIMIAVFVSAAVFHSFSLAAVLLVAVAVFVPIGWLTQPHSEFMRRMKQLRSVGSPLVEIRTQVDDGD